MVMMIDGDGDDDDDDDDDDVVDVDIGYEKKIKIWQRWKDRKMVSYHQ